MLNEVKMGKFWAFLPTSRKMVKNSDIVRYLDVTTGAVLGYLNTFNHRYFLVLKDEGELDLATVKASEIAGEAKAVKQKEKREKAKNDVFAKYSHAIPGTMTFDAAVKKNKVKIKCTICGDTERVVATQDLFQVKCCVSCQSKKREARSVKPKEQVPTGVIATSTTVVVS